MLNRSGNVMVILGEMVRLINPTHGFEPYGAIQPSSAAGEIRRGAPGPPLRAK